MARTRRAYLSTIGIGIMSGCLGNIASSTTANRTSSSYHIEAPKRDTTSAQTTTDGDGTHETTLGFAGDTMVGRGLNGIYGEEGVDPATIWGDFKPQLDSLDGVFCNLECSLSKRGERFPDQKYYFRGDPDWAVPALDAGNIRFTNLANNHAMDFGAVALTDTIDALDEDGIENAGTGRTPAAAWEPATFSVGDLDVAVVSFAYKYEVYAATNDRPGIAWAKTDLDNERTRRVVGNAIERAKSAEPDLLVVSVHWGDNWIEKPNDQLVAFGHWLVDQGVDLVHGHSAHVVQAVEQYGDGLILHDTGDLVDDFGTKDDLGNHNSYLFELLLEGDRFEKLRLVPFHIDDGVSRASDNQAAWLRKTMRERSDQF
ncbi:CapA family protein, partial [Haladaptatus sp.]|uniref:CapA family protein n=1 Tax=Haladaptatus sp. TaxID=1973141 RepID=UPI003C4746B6